MEAVELNFWTIWNRKSPGLGMRVENLICAFEDCDRKWSGAEVGPGLAGEVDNELALRQMEKHVSSPWREVWQVPGNGSLEHWEQVAVLGCTGWASLRHWPSHPCIRVSPSGGGGGGPTFGKPKWNQHFGIFRNFNGTYMKNMQAFLLLHAGAHHAVTIWNLQLRHLACFKENIIIWKPCKEKCVCTNKWHYLPFVKRPRSFTFLLLLLFLVLNNSDIFFKCKIYFWKFLKCKLLFFWERGGRQRELWQLWPSPGSLTPHPVCFYKRKVTKFIWFLCLAMWRMPEKWLLEF